MPAVRHASAQRAATRSCRSAWSARVDAERQEQLAGGGAHRDGARGREVLHQRRLGDGRDVAVALVLERHDERRPVAQRAAREGRGCADLDVEQDQARDRRERLGDARLGVADLLVRHVQPAARELRRAGCRGGRRRRRRSARRRLRGRADRSSSRRLSAASGATA